MTSPVKPDAQPQTLPQPVDSIQTIQRRPMKRAKERETTVKAPSAFRTISEVADELRVQQHVLRFWESKFAQIKPLKRGGGRRYYRPEDVDLIKNIHHLLYNEGYTIKGVQKLLQTTRGNLSGRVTESVPAEAAVPASTLEQKRAELKGMLDELKSLRTLLQE